MGILRVTADSPVVVATTPLRLLILVGEEGTSYPYKDKNDLSLEVDQSNDISGLDSSPIAVDSSLVELKIFCAIFSTFMLVISYFAIKAALRTWKRRNIDYLLTWAHNNMAKQNICKCLKPQSRTLSSEPNLPLTPTLTKAVQDKDGADVITGSPTTSSGVGTVESSDASAETASTNPLLELLSSAPTTSSNQPSPVGTSITVAEIALISTANTSGPFSDAPSLRRHHRQRQARAVASLGRSRKRSSNSSPPSPVFPRRRPDTDIPKTTGSSSIQHHRRRRKEPFEHQQHRHPRHKEARRVSLEAAQERVQPQILKIYGVMPKCVTKSPITLNSTIGALTVNSDFVDREWHAPSRAWVDDDEDARSLSKPSSVATAPPAYFDTMNTDRALKGYCPLYKSHSSRDEIRAPEKPS